ncbi:hypothetical protein ACFXTO_019700 [Malus domestica]
MLTRLEKQMPLRYLKSTLRQITRDFRKMSVHVTDADTSGKINASPISELASSIFELRRVQRMTRGFLASPAFEKASASSIFELASSISELASSISEIPLSADFYRG